MPDTDPPGLAVWITAVKEKVATGVDRVAIKRRELARRQVDGESFGYCAEVEDQGFLQGNRPAREVDSDVAIADLTVRGKRRSDDSPGAIVPVEASLLLALANRWIECPAAAPGDFAGKANHLEKQWADFDR